MNIVKKLTLASLTAATLSATVTPAFAFDIERWLRDTFSTDDFVGDWLRDTFAPVNNDGGGFDSPSIQSDGYRDAVEIMTGWKGVKDPKSIEQMKAKQLCDGNKLLGVILETKSEEKTKATCFKIMK